MTALKIERHSDDAIIGIDRALGFYERHLTESGWSPAGTADLMADLRAGQSWLMRAQSEIHRVDVRENESINGKAFELRSKLFALVNEFKDFQGTARNAPGDVDVMIEAHGQIDTAACALARVHESLGDLFIDLDRDADRQVYAIERTG